MAAWPPGIKSGRKFVRLIDTNVCAWAMERNHRLHAWSRNQIALAVEGEGAAVCAITLAELCASETRDPKTVGVVLRKAGLKLLDTPVAAAEICGVAYRKYLSRRKTESGKDGPKTPMGDFFIGAHAELMGWPIVTGDRDRFKTYFPSVELIMPASE